MSVRAFNTPGVRAKRSVSSSEARSRNISIASKCAEKSCDNECKRSAALIHSIVVENVGVLAGTHLSAATSLRCASVFCISCVSALEDVELEWIGRFCAQAARLKTEVPNYIVNSEQECGKG